MSAKFEIPQITKINKQKGYNEFIYNSKTEWIYKFDENTNTYQPDRPLLLIDAFQLSSEKEQ